MTTTESATTDLTAGSTTGARERADLLQSLTLHRSFLRTTARGLTEEQARLQPTASELSVGGLIKHVSMMEAQWSAFIERGAAAMQGDAADQAQWAGGFALGDDETLAGVLAAYEAVAARTDALLGSLPDLDADHALPPAPWFQPGARWSARRVLLHLVAETAQHAGHADILRESIDGQKTMG